jgi:signal transduction histidine kinase
MEDIGPPSDSQTALFRIFQEALTNVARHSQASAVTVTLETRADTLQLTVSDNGRGISAATLAGRGSLGLMGMRERAQQLGGVMDIRSEPGEGTTVRVRVPSGGGGEKRCVVSEVGYRAADWRAAGRLDTSRPY